MAVKSRKPKTIAQKINPVKVVEPGFINNFLEKVTTYRPSKNVYIILLIAGILLLATYKKEWFIAAMVNNQPVSNFELQSRLNKQFRTQTLNQMVNEKIVLDEAAKKRALPKETEIDNKLADIEKSVGGAKAFDTLLAQQGQSRESVRQQLRIQLSIEKLFAKDATVSAQEIESFIETNKDILRATDSASQIKEAEETLKQQKLSQTFQQKFQELRQKAKIQTF